MPVLERTLVIYCGTNKQGTNFSKLMQYKQNKYHQVKKMLELKAKAKRDYLQECERERNVIMLRRWNIIRKIRDKEEQHQLTLTK